MRSEAIKRNISATVSTAAAVHILIIFRSDFAAYFSRPFSFAILCTVFGKIQCKILLLTKA